MVIRLLISLKLNFTWNVKPPNCQKKLEKSDTINYHLFIFVYRFIQKV